ncbi:MULTISPECIES: GGDEF and EAL domain-containing protein [unclassified Rhizobium]|uniref:putative bifunctional diguanylate cyclase/phosphodiesterase n=1 Tax=unclassified Rhizobium TaxID=2613769 RepID=UPI00161EF5E2|nr:MULTISPECIES: GGDEF and EAL domain-containing protein [unclassified Rhizobium]MBB3386760.1 diguanylate cyclase (GGDEF)-like protein/PAS domain S-box-containing protein [Rhizobium sp. BK098]MBB3618385.1 diguanylate cyclase (GGDEF)-like protein/PAS domain S-box-containing protein [Rhizobium sp. BK609]MBB3684121.1 diguanylate cyclase (GGDEF)-like protein/PAS domain S-box-containing protein [Rhizobium sp. BK612]
MMQPPDGAPDPTHRDQDVEDEQVLKPFELLQARYQSLAERYEWLEAMINYVPDYIYAKDRNGRFLFANLAIVLNNGFTHVDELIGLTDAEIHPMADAYKIEEVERQVMESGKADLGVEERRLKGEGWLMMSRVPLRDRNGNIIGVVGASRDISARKRAEKLMSAQTKLLQDVARGVDLDVFLRESQVLLEELLNGRRVSFVLNGDQAEPLAGDILEFPIFSRDGGRHGALVTVQTDGDEAGLMEFFAGIAQTVGIAIDRHRDIAHIAYLAEHDALTGLPNRMLLDRKLSALLEKASRQQRSLAVAFVDLDNFKLVNDTLGHAAGDELLTVVARRISTQVGEGGVVARIGGDEFIIVLEDPAEPIYERLAAVLADISQPMIVQGVEIRVGCSIGVACAMEHGTTASELFANADMALYRAKEAGRNAIRLFTPAMAEDARNKLIRIEELRRAVERDEFVLHYQPQKEVRSGKIIGVEALVRWQHPVEGLLLPGVFIPLAEETGLIVPLGEIVLRKACQQARLWQDRGLPALRMGVNVSARQFLESSLTSHVASALQSADLDPQWLELELTESLIMRDVEGAIERMHELKELGVSLAMDDFGTGYSSLSTLRRFPLSRLKIDRSFIADIPEKPGDMAITSAIVSLGRTLDLEVVAEGVETEEQARFLEGAGCELLQGYLFARPLPSSEIESLITGTVSKAV